MALGTSDPFKKTPKEIDIESDIIDTLRACGYLAWKNSTQGTYDVAAGRYRALSSRSMKGVADIICVVPIGGLGITIFLEVKTFKGKQSDAQKDFERSLRAVGGYYGVIRSVDDAMDVINSVKTHVSNHI
jgi:hypothetical protein